MPLVCPNCKTVFADPGGDLRGYYCHVCGYTPLQRTPVAPLSDEAMVGLIAGAGVGAALGGPAGAIVGALAGLVLGARQTSLKRK
jgi:hypothetical protein